MPRRARIHRRVEVDVWQSRDFRALSAPRPNAQTLWLWLLTSERTTIVPGLVLARPAVMADDLRWPLRGFNAALSELEGAGMVEVDRDAGIVLLAKALVVDGKPREGAAPHSVNAAKSWATTLLKLAPSALRDSVHARADVVISQCEAKIRSAYAEAMGTACAGQDASRAHGERTQGSENREQRDLEETHTGPGPSGASGSYQPPPPVNRGRDRVTETAERLYDRYATYLRRLAATIPGCPEPITGGMAPARTLTAIAAVVSEWFGQAAAAGADADQHVEAQLQRLVAVRTVTARRVQHVKFWASSTFWDLDGIEKDLLVSPEQAADAARSGAGPPRSPRPEPPRQHTAGAEAERLLRELETARTEGPQP